MVGCARDGTGYACTCELLTDRDDIFNVQVDICAANDQRAPGLAKNCAESGAPAPIQRCACVAVTDGPKCKEGACKLKP